MSYANSFIEAFKIKPIFRTMRKISILVMLSLLAQKGLAQSVTIDPRNATNKIIEMKSTSGGILIPRMTSVQRNNIQSLPEGLLVYDTDIKSFFFVQSGFWKGIFGEISLPYSGTYNIANASGFYLLNNENSVTANAGKFEAPYGIGIHGIGGDMAGKFISAGGRGIYAEGAIAGEFYGGNGIGVKIDVNGNNYNSLVIPRGRVGIGTLSPSALFQVKGSINDYLWETTANETPNTSDITVGLRVNQQYIDSPETAKVMFGTKTNHPLNFFTNDNFNSPDMTLYNGKVGIGTTSPSASLEVYGSTILSGITNITPIEANDADDGVVKVFSPPNGGNSFQYLALDKDGIQTRSHSITFPVIKTEQNLKLNPYGGNVGIGTRSDDINSTLSLQNQQVVLMELRFLKVQLIQVIFIME